MCFNYVQSCFVFSIDKDFVQFLNSSDNNSNKQFYLIKFLNGIRYQGMFFNRVVYEFL